MADASEVLNPATILEEFKKNRVTHLVWLPDSETNFMYQVMKADPSLKLIPVCREGETIAIAAGLHLGDKKPVVLIQNSGMFESGDSIRGMGLDLQLPLVMVIGYRGWTRHGVTRDSAALFTEHYLHSWGVNYYVVETDADVHLISVAFEEAERTSKPVAVLLGREYG